MPVDFATRSLFNKQSGIIDDECLIMLEREGARDRVWRIQFDRVQSLVVWRTIPWWWSIPIGIILVTSVLLLFVSEPVANGIGLGILVTVLLLGSWLVYCKNTHMAFHRDGTVVRITFMVRPSKQKRIVQRIRENIARTQARIVQVNEQLGLTAKPIAENTSSEPAAEQVASEPSSEKIAGDQPAAESVAPDPYNPAPPAA